jgi:hypothetical protein
VRVSYFSAARNEDLRVERADGRDDAVHAEVMGTNTAKFLAPAVAMEECTAHAATHIVEAVLPRGDVVAGEASLGRLMPITRSVRNPLVAIGCNAALIPVPIREVLQKGVQAGQVFVRLRVAEAYDQIPFPRFRSKKTSGVDGVSLAIGSSPVQ